MSKFKRCQCYDETGRRSRGKDKELCQECFDWTQSAIKYVYVPKPDPLQGLLVIRYE